VVVVSSYLPEVLGLADRVLVMRGGTVAGELPAEGATEEDVLRLASVGGSGGRDGVETEETGA
jgi:rhamnose transport system ATP-binding protein